MTTIDKNIVPIFRTVKGAINEIKKVDPDTCVSERIIRALIENKKVVSFQNGNRTVVELNSLLLALSTGLDVSSSSSELQKKKKTHKNEWDDIELPFAS